LSILTARTGPGFASPSPVNGEIPLGSDGNVLVRLGVGEGVEVGFATGEGELGVGDGVAVGPAAGEHAATARIAAMTISRAMGSQVIQLP
jgi:hypothetical protein